MESFIPQMEPQYGEEEINAVTDYLRSGGWMMEFKKTSELEGLISEFSKAKYTIMVTNGTVSLILALLALEIQPGDEVLVPDLTMIATPNACKLLNIKPILVDVDPMNLCLDVEKAKEKITDKTKAMIYVPLNGRSHNMNEIVEFCENNNIYLIEDAAQALGSYWKNKHLGNFGDIGSFSFSVPKIITTGQGGALVTGKAKIAKKIKLLKNFGREKGGMDIHDTLGWNFRFTDLQAVIGIEQMKKLNERIIRKKEIYQRYENGFRDINEIRMLDTNLNYTSPWFIDIFVRYPNKLAEHLKSKNIGTRIFYPPVHSQKIYEEEFGDEKFPITTHYSKRGLWLPSSSGLTNQQIDYIIKEVKNFFLK